MKKFTKTVVLTLAAAIIIGMLPASVFTAEASARSADAFAPFTRYRSTVRLTVGKENNAGGSFARGESAFDNGITRLIKEALNVEIVNKGGLFHRTGDSFNIVGGEYNTQLALRVASNTLPDTFYIQDNSPGQQMFKMLLEGKRLADLTEIYNTVIIGEAKKALDKVNKAELLRFMTVDGKIYGVTGGGEAINFPYMWVRQDWLDQLGLAVPTTIAEFEAVALAFIEAKPGGNPNTTGFVFNPYPGGMFGQWFGAIPIFNSLGSYPNAWIDKGGSIVNGAIQPETKTALAVLADWYEKGIIPKDFATLANGDEIRDAYVSTNGCGIFSSAWWQPWPNWDGHGEGSVNRDPGFAWTPVLGPVNAGGNFSALEDIFRPGGQVVNIRCRHPEAVILAMNVMAEYDGYRVPNERADEILAPMRAQSDGRTCSPFVGGIAPPRDRLDTFDAIEAYLVTGATDTTASDYWAVKGAFDFINDNGVDFFYNAGGVAGTSDAQKEEAMNRYVGYWGFYIAGGLLGAEGALDLVYPAFKGVTESDSEYGGILKDLTETVFHQIVTGVRPVDYFDTFVAQWKRSGGDIITKEINAAMK